MTKNEEQFDRDLYDQLKRYLHSRTDFGTKHPNSEFWKLKKETISLHPHPLEVEILPEQNYFTARFETSIYDKDEGQKTRKDCNFQLSEISTSLRNNNYHFNFDKSKLFEL